MNRSTIARWIIAVGATAIALATLLPAPGEQTVHQLCVICGPSGGVDAVLNVLLFAPIGFGLALARVRPRRAAAVVIAYSLLIELLQLHVIPGRDSSVGDVIMNSLGGCVGYLAGHFWFTLLQPRADTAVRLAATWLGIWLSSQVFVAYTFIQTLPDPPYFGQIDRPDGHSRLAFPGSVLASTVEMERITPGELPNAATLKRLLARREGAQFRVVAVPGGVVSGRAELTVVSAPGMGVVSLEQDEESLLFGIRTGAERLRLRPYEYRLHGVFRDRPMTAQRDTALFHGRFTRRLVTVGAMTKDGEALRTFVPRLSQGWIPLMPLRTYVDDDFIELVTSAAFLALLMAPTGYWMYFGRTALLTRSTARVAAAAAYLLVVIGGLAVVPLIFGMRPAAVWEWGFVVGGTGVGILLAQALRRLNLQGARRAGGS